MIDLTQPEAARLWIPLAAMCANPIAQVLSKRLLYTRNAVLKSEATGVAAGLALLCALNARGWEPCCFRPGELWAGLISDIILYLLLSYGYFHFVNLSVTARRIRMLRELAASGPLAPQELMARYSPSDIIGIRLDRLVGSGQIVRREGRYYGARRFPVWWIARVITALKHVVIGKGSEFE